MTNRAFFHPKFLPTWLLIALMRACVWLPFGVQIRLGKWIGGWLYRLLKKRRKIAFINISHCFKDKNPAQVTRLVRQHFEALGVSFFEVANTFYLSDKRLKKRYQIQQTHHLQNALDNHQNIILLVGHFSTMMFAGRILAQNFAFADLYRPQNNPLFNHIMQQSFTRHGVRLITAKDSKNLIKTLKSGLPIWYAPDQDLGSKNSTMSPFFDASASTINATAKLAKIKNTVVIPLSFYRNKNGYVLRFSSAISHYPSANKLENTTKTNQILQTQILKAPEQYLWIHKRFKTRGENQPDLYRDLH